MAYPKITVNTGLSLEVIASDTLPIPYPGLSTLSGTNGTTQNGITCRQYTNFYNRWCFSR